MEEKDKLSKIPTPVPAMYRRKGVMTRGATSSSRDVNSDNADVVWEQIKRPMTIPDDDVDVSLFKLGSMPRPALSYRAKLARKPELSEKKNLQEDLEAEEFETLVISKPPSESPATSRSEAMPVKRKSPSNPYDFDDDEEPSGGSQSSSQGSSSQTSTGSTASLKGPSRKKVNGSTEAVFRKPIRPKAAPSQLPAIKRGNTFPPSRKRSPPQTADTEPPRKVASPEKLQSSPPEAVPSTSNGITHPKASTSKPSTDLRDTKDPKDSKDSKDSKVAPIPAKAPVKAPVRALQSIPPLPDCFDERDAFASKNLIEVLMKGMMKTGNSCFLRCQNSIKLANFLLNPSFRLDFFAHAPFGVFEVLKDAVEDENVALSLSTLVLVLSTDNLKMNVDQKALQLMAAIVQKGVGGGGVGGAGGGGVGEGRLNKEIVESVYAVVAKSKLAKEVPKEVISAPRLLLEALMTMKLGSQLSWFIDEVRHQGLIKPVIDHLVATLAQLLQKPTMAKLHAIHRISEFFYKVMHNNKENAVTLMSTCKSAGFGAIVSVIKFCVTQVSQKQLPDELRNEVGVVLRSLLSLLVNLSGHADLWRIQMGARPGLMEALIRACFEMNGFLPREKSQEILIRALLCMVNLTFNCEENCKVFLEVKPVNTTRKCPNLLLFVELIKKTNDDAVASADDLDRYTEQYDKMIRVIEHEADITITDVLDKAGENLEHFAIMCYVGLLLAHLISQSDDAQNLLKGYFTDVFGSVGQALTVATEAIKRMSDFVTDAKAENIHPVQEMNAAVDALESYGYRNS